MKKYKYTGADYVPFSYENKDYFLTPNEEVELPEDSPYVKSLLAQKKLTKVITSKKP